MINGKELRDARVRADLTQPQLAELVGVTQRSISSWENGSVPRNKEARVRDALLAIHPNAFPEDAAMARRAASARHPSRWGTFTESVGLLAEWLQSEPRVGDSPPAESLLVYTDEQIAQDFLRRWEERGVTIWRLLREQHEGGASWSGRLGSEESSAAPPPGSFVVSPSAGEPDAGVVLEQLEPDPQSPEAGKDRRPR